MHDCDSSTPDRLNKIRVWARKSGKKRADSIRSPSRLKLHKMTEEASMQRELEMRDSRQALEQQVSSTLRREQEERDFRQALELQQQEELLADACKRKERRFKAQTRPQYPVATNFGRESDSMFAHRLQEEEFLMLDVADGAHNASSTEERHQHSSEPDQDEVMARRIQGELDEEIAIKMTFEDDDITRSRGNRRWNGRRHGPLVAAAHDPYHGMMFSMVPRQRRAAVERTPPVESLLESLNHMRSFLPEETFRGIQAHPENLLLDLIGGHVAPPAVLLRFSNFDGNDYEALWDIAEMLGDAQPQGLESDEIEQLPTCNYKPRSPRVDATGDIDNETAQCKVCLEDFQGGDTLRTLPCCHKFHRDCIDEWIKKKSVCPICRVEIRDEIRGASGHG